MCGCDYAKCKKTCECPCHGHVERESDRAYKVGQSTGLDQAARALLERAAASFKSGRDEEARTLRSLSQELSERAVERHPGAPKPD